MPNIAFIGKAGAGKTTAAQLLEDLGYVRISFAAPLKDFAAELWGDEARTDRDKLQKLGVGARMIDEDVWVNLLMKKLRHPLSHGPWSIDDCRFPNEYWALKGGGFVIVRVEAPRTARIDRLKANGKWQNEEQLEHESETAIDGLEPDHRVGNDGTTDDFYDRLVDLIIKERRRR